jgi:hypothetical protein
MQLSRSSLILVGVILCTSLAKGAFTVPDDVTTLEKTVEELLAKYQTYTADTIPEQFHQAIKMVRQLAGTYTEPDEVPKFNCGNFDDAVKIPLNAIWEILDPPKTEGECKVQQTNSVLKFLALKDLNKARMSMDLMPECSGGKFNEDIEGGTKLKSIPPRNSEVTYQNQSINESEVSDEHLVE